MATWLILSDRISRHRAFWASIPLASAAILSIPIFLPEIPHLNLVFISVLWLTIGIITIWIHDIPFPVLPPPKDSEVRSSIREYLKEYVSLWKTLLLAAFAGYLGILISMLTTAYASNRFFLRNPGEVFLVNINSNVQASLLSLFILTGPLLEIAVKALWGIRSLLPVVENTLEMPKLDQPPECDK